MHLTPPTQVFLKKVYPRVSLLIPCYNAAEFVDDAIQSALEQTYPHVEIVVAPDDGHTYEQLRKRFSSPQLRILPPGPLKGTGAGAARNRAIDAASGDFFAMLDADDLIPPNYISALMAIAIEEGAALAPIRYLQWDRLKVVRTPPIHNSSLSLSGYSQLLASIHPLIHRSFENGYDNGFAEDVVHDGLVIAAFGTMSIVNTISYDNRIRVGSACGNGSEAELAIQKSYRYRINQILLHPTELGLQRLSRHDRIDFANLFRFREWVSSKFSSVGTDSYNEWVAGKEAQLWDDFWS